MSRSSRADREPSEAIRTIAREVVALIFGGLPMRNRDFDGVNLLRALCTAFLERLMRCAICVSLNPSMARARIVRHSSLDKLRPRPIVALERDLQARDARSI